MGKAPQAADLQAAFRQVSALVNAHKLGEASALVSRIRQASPENVEAIFWQARIALLMKKYEQAESLAQQALKQAPNSATLWRLLGEAATSLRHHEVAHEAFAKALKLDPMMPGLEVAAGIALARTENHSEAIDHFNRGIKHAPGNPAGYHNLGNSLIHLKQFEAAVAAFRESVKLQPGNPIALYALGRALIWLGEFEESLTHLGEAFRMRPDMLQIISYRILALRHLERHDEADALEGLHDMITPVHLDCPSEFTSMKDFNAALRDEVTNHPALTTEYYRRATRNGAKVDHMFGKNETPLFKIFARETRKAFDTARSQMPKRDSLPIPIEIDGDYRMEMWANVMYDGGHQAPHNHPSGWFSASCYTTLPDRVESSGDAQEGWIEFGGTAYDFPAAPHMPTRRIKPEEGMMVVFPSYIFHRTIPFHSDQIRLSCAFDAKPLNWRR